MIFLFMPCDRFLNAQLVKFCNDNDDYDPRMSVEPDGH